MAAAMERHHWGWLLLGVACGAAVGIALAPEATQRWKRTARAAVGRGREAADVAREAIDVFRDFQRLARPLDGGIEAERGGA
jgi:hypothetical protein